MRADFCLWTSHPNNGYPYCTIYALAKNAPFSFTELVAIEAAASEKFGGKFYTWQWDDTAEVENYYLNAPTRGLPDRNTVLTHTRFDEATEWLAKRYPTLQLITRKDKQRRFYLMEYIERRELVTIYRGRKKMKYDFPMWRAGIEDFYRSRSD